MNPASAGGRTGRHFDRVERAVRASHGDLRAVFTTRRGEATEMAREAVRAGERLIVAVGGDGTVSEVVDGIAGTAPPGGGEVLLGCIPQGTGGDLRRTLGWPLGAEEAARALADGLPVACDVGRVEFTGPDGKPRLRHFVNVSSFGVSGRVVQLLARGGRLGGGKLTYALASARALIGHRDQMVRWRTDGGAWVEEPITALAVCNGRFFGAGMLVAPSARTDDGWLEVTRWTGLGIRDFLARRRMLYDGTHVRLPSTRCLRAQVVEAEPVGRQPVLLDVDGEQPGRLPARWSVLPGALRVLVPRARP